MLLPISMADKMCGHWHDGLAAYTSTHHYHQETPTSVPEPAIPQASQSACAIRQHPTDTRAKGMQRQRRVYLNPTTLSRYLRSSICGGASCSSLTRPRDTSARGVPGSRHRRRCSCMARLVRKDSRALRCSSSISVRLSPISCSRWACGQVLGRGGDAGGRSSLSDGRTKMQNSFQLSRTQ